MAGGRITISRVARGWLASARSYRVLLDGKAEARVNRGHMVTVFATEGRHELQLAVDWQRSPKLVLDLADGGDVRIQCGPNGNPLVSLFRGIFTPRRFIVIDFDARSGGA